MKDKKEKMSYDTKVTLILFVALLFTMIAGICKISSVYMVSKEKKQAETTIINDDTGCMYIICDASFNENYTKFNITLPNGKEVVIDNKLDDFPDEIREVVISTNDINDTSTFKVVGLR